MITVFSGSFHLLANEIKLLVNETKLLANKIKPFKKSY